MASQVGWPGGRKKPLAKQSQTYDPMVFTHIDRLVLQRSSRARHSSVSEVDITRQDKNHQYKQQLLKSRHCFPDATQDYI